MPKSHLAAFERQVAAARNGSKLLQEAQWLKTRAAPGQTRCSNAQHAAQTLCQKGLAAASPPGKG
jgi:hypothetical protein